jgi:hypothetical protein
LPFHWALLIFPSTSNDTILQNDQDRNLANACASKQDHQARIMEETMSLGFQLLGCRMKCVALIGSVVLISHATAEE